MTAGKHFRSIAIDELNLVHQFVFNFSMQEVIIGSLRQGASGPTPTETLTLQFANVSTTGATATSKTVTLLQQIQ